MPDYDVIVVGGGHAGIEAALAAARMDCKVALVVFDRGQIGQMSCNPSIGGVGKAQLVREIDALGGEMARAADACYLQLRMLNASKGPAVWSLRAQIDMQRYKHYMQQVLARQPNLTIREAEVTGLLLCNQRVAGVRLNDNQEITAYAVVLCVGTFLDGLIHIGLRNFSGGRIGEPASIKLTQHLRQLGLNLLRFKTGTCPRIDKDSIDYSRLIRQDGEELAFAFSYFSPRRKIQQLPCYITYTNPLTHQIINDNLNRSPLYTGVIKATGVRYCPSIEDKVVRFAQRSRHQIFLEPVGEDTKEVYPNGLSTSLPEDVQLKMLRSIDGLQKAEVLRFGYGIEHTVVCPKQLYPTLQLKNIPNLFLAGQINGTTGYEEAASQGLLAGINAALLVKGRELLVLTRTNSYIGVLIDDLTSKGTNEPYRMFTSRVEYRLLLRQDNADRRLCQIGYNLGLVSKDNYEATKKKEKDIAAALELLKKTRLTNMNKKAGGNLFPVNCTAFDLLKRPHMTMEELEKLVSLDIPAYIRQDVEIEVKYSGFIERQQKEVERLRELEKVSLPMDIDYNKINGLSRESIEKLNKFKPLNLAQAGRIPGITPAALSIIWVYLRNRKNK